MVAAHYEQLDKVEGAFLAVILVIPGSAILPNPKGRPKKKIES
jgi:hypothetical protein